MGWTGCCTSTRTSSSTACCPEGKLPAGICPLPSRDWSDLRVYAPSPHAIGLIRGYMPPPLTPLVP
eukprot:3443660-Pyramimonas_sp.AAC.1